MGFRFGGTPLRAGELTDVEPETAEHEIVIPEARQIAAEAERLSAVIQAKHAAGIRPAFQFSEIPFGPGAGISVVGDPSKYPSFMLNFRFSGKVQHTWTSWPGRFDVIGIAADEMGWPFPTWAPRARPYDQARD